MNIDYLKGKTIALEGIDACGKNSISTYLYDYLGHHGLKVKVFEYVNDVPIAKTVRDLMFKSGITISEKSREFLYSAIAAQTIELANQYRSENKDSLIIFDRCVISMMAFQALSNNNTDALKTISLLYTALCGDYNCIGTNIDDIFYIKISPETSISRCSLGCDYDPGLDKLRRVKESYDSIFNYGHLSNCSGSLYELIDHAYLWEVDGELSVENVANDILLKLMHKYGGEEGIECHHQISSTRT